MGDPTQEVVVVIREGGREIVIAALPLLEQQGTKRKRPGRLWIEVVGGDRRGGCIGQRPELLDFQKTLGGESLALRF